MRNTVFGELPVIEQIISDYWKIRMDVQDDDVTTSQYWYSFISKYSELILNIEESAFIELSKTNKIVMQLIKKSQTGGCKLSFWNEHQCIMEKDHRYVDFPNAFFLLNCSDFICEQKIIEYGLLFMNGNTYQSFTEKLFYPLRLLVNTNSKWSDISSWHDLKKIALPTNSLILTDNYISNRKADIEYNLIPLLDAMLPDKLEKEGFNLIIITQEMPFDDFSRRFSEIQGYITGKLARPYEIVLSLITAKISKNHDRRIFTNYCLYESGNSFTYFDDSSNVQKDTILSAFPSSMIGSGKELLLNKNLTILKWVKELVENKARQKKESKPGISNRLLTMIPR